MHLIGLYKGPERKTELALVLKGKKSQNSRTLRWMGACVKLSWRHRTGKQQGVWNYWVTAALHLKYTPAFRIMSSRLIQSVRLEQGLAFTAKQISSCPWIRYHRLTSVLWSRLWWLAEHIPALDVFRTARVHQEFQWNMEILRCIRVVRVFRIGTYTRRMPEITRRNGIIKSWCKLQFLVCALILPWKEMLFAMTWKTGATRQRMALWWSIRGRRHIMHQEHCISASPHGIWRRSLHG